MPHLGTRADLQSTDGQHQQVRARRFEESGLFPLLCHLTRLPLGGGSEGACGPRNPRQRQSDKGEFSSFLTRERLPIPPGRIILLSVESPPVRLMHSGRVPEQLRR